MSSKIGFTPCLLCPICGEHHEVKFKYRDMDVLVCPKAEENKLMFFTMELADEKEAEFRGNLCSSRPSSFEGKK